MDYCERVTRVWVSARGDTGKPPGSVVLKTTLEQHSGSRLWVPGRVRDVPKS